MFYQYPKFFFLQTCQFVDIFDSKTQGLRESSYEFATDEVSKRRQIGPAALVAWTNVLQVAWTVNSYVMRPLGKCL